MIEYLTYVDGSYHTEGETHGGVVLWGGSPETSNCFHVVSHHPDLYSMRNVGGELLAAYYAIMSMAHLVKKANLDSIEEFRLNLVYDYKGIGEWSTGGWKANKPGTQWYMRNIRKVIEEVPNLDINFIWVKGHSENIGNELADRVADYTMSYTNQNNLPIYTYDVLQG